jgi:DNA-binding NarL/FixJ family response regulator
VRRETTPSQAQGAAINPDLVPGRVSARRRGEPQVRAVLAEGRSHPGIARQLWVTGGTVEKHVHRILTKLTPPEADDAHRRVA